MKHAIGSLAIALLVVLVFVVVSEDNAAAQCPPGMVCIPQSQFYGGGFPQTGSYGYGNPYGFGGYPFGGPSPYYAGPQFQFSGSCYGGGFSPYSFQPQFQQFSPYGVQSAPSLQFAFRQ